MRLAAAIPHGKARLTLLLLALATDSLVRARAVRPVGAVARPRIDIGQSWPLGRVAFSLLPLSGSDRRKTLQTEVVRERVWTHDQIQGIVNVNVPVRQTVIRLREGGLWVHNPVAPSGECIRQMRQLEAKYGPVKHIVLGTLGLEHKALAGPFSKSFPEATVWVQPGQWSFPLPLPLSTFGFPVNSERLRVLPPSGSSDEPSWATSGEIEYETLGPLRFKAVGAFGETAFFHRDTKTLIVTDSVVEVRDDPPAIIEEDPRALLFHARNDIGDEVANTPETRQRGWRRICLFGLTFFPSGIDVTLKSCLADLSRRPRTMEVLSGDVPLGLYPWRWARDERPSFEALRGGLLCAPILQELILNRFPEETLQWATRVAKWKFTRIIPCHFSNDIRASPAQWLAAFEFLRSPARELGKWRATAAPQPHILEGIASPADAFVKLLVGLGVSKPLKQPAALEADLRLLSAASDLCTKAGLVEPVSPAN